MKTKIVILIAILVLASGCGNQTPEPASSTTKPYSNSGDCVLSLCDCKCHLKGTTQEEVNGVLCGINCAKEFEVVGCRSEGGVCVEIGIEEQEGDTGVGIANPASQKCVADGGTSKIIQTEGGEGGVCLFSDGSVCDEWAYFRGECSRGECMKKCGAIGTRSEGWYDCNNKLINWEKCST